MKIVLWHENFYPRKGGGPSHISNLISYLNFDFDCMVITDFVHRQPLREAYQKNVEIYRLPRSPIVSSSQLLQKRILSFPLRIIYELQTFHSKIRYVKKTNFDLLHIHGIVFYNSILRLNRLFKKHIYQKIVDFSFVKQPKLLTLHNFFPGFTNDKIIIDAYNHYIDQIDNIICVDRHIFDYCSNYCSEKNYRKNIWFIPNSINTDLYCYFKSQPEKNLIIGFAGRLSGTVDINMINKIILSLPENMEFHLAVTGDTRLLRKNERTKIFENISQDKMPDFYRNVDIILNPLLHKGISRVTLEAMACGKPVIAYNNTDRYPIENGRTGFLVNRDTKGILDLLQRIQKNKSILNEFGIASRKLVEEKFSNSVILPRIKTVYECLIAGKDIPIDVGY